MPTVDVVTTPLAAAEVDLVVVGAFAPSSDDPDAPPELAADAVAIGEALDIDLAADLAAAGFDASVGSTVRVPTRGAIPAPTVLAVGLGERDKVTAVQLRRAAAAASGAAERVERLATALHTVLDDVAPDVAGQVVAEGIVLGAYRFTRYRTDERPHLLATATLHAEEDADAVRSGVGIAAVTAAGTALARDLVNTPPQDKRPPALADRAVAAFDGTGVEVRVLDEGELERDGYGGLLGVGQGSSAPPRLVELTYVPDGWDAASGRHVALVGKGITFDTGGVSLKPSGAMMTMKMDMAGAAAVLAVVKAAAELELPVKLTGLLALAENMPSGTATRVSDVLTLKDGTTVEVTNTDAEGRLVLADALARAGELEPDAIVDVATLTGAAKVALGDRIGALLASDDDLATALLDAADAAGEPLWRLPLAPAEYGERLEGAIADVRNSVGPGAATIIGALFLHRFVGEDVPWAHLDIAGVAWADEPYGIHPKGGTGVPVRTLLAWLRAS